MIRPWLGECVVESQMSAPDNEGDNECQTKRTDRQIIQEEDSIRGGYNETIGISLTTNLQT
jgi:hypothetical protein